MVIIIFAFFLVINSTKAHDINEIHKMCNETSDYSGCIKYNSNFLPSKKNKKQSLDSWRSYGPLRINWSRWKTKERNHIVPALNLQKKPIFIAINCDKLLLNTTGINLTWKGWLSPNYRFESNLLNDYCKNIDS